MDNCLQREHPPVGNLLLRTLAMPGDTNPAGDIFGGCIMSQMDIAGALLAREVANGRVVTVAVEGMSFLKPVAVGDIVCCYGNCTHVGNTSLKVHMEIWVKKFIESPTDEHAER
ncbi:MAG: acyl-CoA thioesterase, partial [Succinivibrio sp.]|nr:acyl-CoA thioesterase [Succinivibrio sp.]